MGKKQETVRLLTLSDGRVVHECGCSCGDDVLHEREHIESILLEYGVEQTKDYLRETRESQFTTTVALPLASPF